VQVIEMDPVSESNLRTLKSYHDDFGIMPFLGAGVSKTRGLPTWFELLSELCDLLEPESRATAMRLLRRLRYLETATAIEERLGRNRMLLELRGRMTPRCEGTTANGALLDTILALNLRLLVTTNFDRVVEEAYGAGQIRPVLGREGHRVVQAVFARGSIEPCLIKLHGCIELQDTIVLTETDYETMYANVSYTKLVGTALAAHPCLFVGCSLERDKTLNVLRQIRRAGITTPAFAMLPERRTKRQAALQRSLLADLGVHPIWYPAGQHQRVPELLSELKQRQVVSAPWQGNAVIGICISVRPVNTPIDRERLRRIFRETAKAGDSHFGEMDGDLENVFTAILWQQHWPSVLPVARLVRMAATIAETIGGPADYCVGISVACHEFRSRSILEAHHLREHDPERRLLGVSHLRQRADEWTWTIAGDGQVRAGDTTPWEPGHSFRDLAPLSLQATVHCANGGMELRPILVETDFGTCLELEPSGEPSCRRMTAFAEVRVGAGGGEWSQPPKPPLASEDVLRFLNDLPASIVLAREGSSVRLTVPRRHGVPGMTKTIALQPGESAPVGNLLARTDDRARTLWLSSRQTRAENRSTLHINITDGRALAEHARETT
jgi:hypothetical protein